MAKLGQLEVIIIFNALKTRGVTHPMFRQVLSLFLTNE